MLRWFFLLPGRADVVIPWIERAKDEFWVGKSDMGTHFEARLIARGYAEEVFS